MTEKPVRIPGSVWLVTLLFWLANLAFLLRFARPWRGGLCPGTVSATRSLRWRRTRSV